jgi:AcrR family transcriptional regulator
MVQARAETTRRKIINAAVDLFCETGYAGTGLGDIIERAEMTKGALYYHFDSKESLASAIIDEGAATVLGAFRGVCESPSPALENMVHGMFVVADLVADDKVARTGRQLTQALGEFNEAASRTHRQWLEIMAAQAARAGTEGDLREDLDPDAVAESVVAAMLGAELISNATSGGADLIGRLTRMWEILLPAIATDASLPYFREFLARESLRHLRPALSIE